MGYNIDIENNKVLAGMFRQIADLLEEQEVAFKPAAYRRAAGVIDELPKDISLYGGIDELIKLPSIGEGIAKKIVEYLDTGKIKILDNLRMGSGGICPELMNIEGLGPKRVRQIHEAFGVRTVEDLVKACKQGKLRALPGFSELMEKKILENAQRVGERVRRFSREAIKNEVESLIKKIRDMKGVERAEIAGSYRRENDTVGDIDILVVTDKPSKVSGSIVGMKTVRNVVAQGDRKLSFDLKDGLRVDVRFVKSEQWGSALLYFTGSKEHNIVMRRVAMSNGWKLNEYGLFQGDIVLASRTEEDIYRKLGLEYREPRDRK